MAVRGVFSISIKSELSKNFGSIRFFLDQKKKGEKTCKETNFKEKGLFAICRKRPSIEMISSF
jgi:hypothetical protein